MPRPRSADSGSRITDGGFRIADRGSRIAALAAHAYTASGAVLAFLAATDIFEHDYRTAFFWLYLQVVVDATDGLLARRVRVSEWTPWFNGAKLDDIVDYLCYVFVPALFVWRALLVPADWATPVAAAMLVSSAYGFNRDDAKTADHFFTGFPSYWNIVVFYLFVARWPAEVNAAILVALAVMVFVPIRYLYPSRGGAYQALTNTLGVIWGALMLMMLWQFPAVSRPVFLASLVFPVYYTILSFVLDARRRRSAVAAR
jgi:phosphatidylcholine synthase